MFQTLYDGFCGLVYPPHCLICKKPFPFDTLKGSVCLPCRETIVRNAPPFCPKCSRHLRNPRLPRCPDCTKHPPPFDFAWAACPYESPLSELLRSFKYNHKTRLRELFGNIMCGFIETYNLDIRQFDTIVPMPLSPSRIRERGFNQSELLAEEIARTYHIPLTRRNLIRWRATEHQARLTQKERWTNISGAFRIKQPAGFSNKNVLIVDDLLTTGATVFEAARTLKSIDVKTVGVFTLAIKL